MLGVIAMQDAGHEAGVGRPEHAVHELARANALLNPPYRTGWTL